MCEKCSVFLQGDENWTLFVFPSGTLTVSVPEGEFKSIGLKPPPKVLNLKTQNPAGTNP